MAAGAPGGGEGGVTEDATGQTIGAPRLDFARIPRSEVGPRRVDVVVGGGAAGAVRNLASTATLDNGLVLVISPSISVAIDQQ